MDIYYSLVSLLICGMLFTWNSCKLDKKVFIFLSIIVIAIVAFREETIGMDTMNYLYFFNDPYAGYSDGRSIEEMEPAYTILNIILYAIFPDNNVFIFATSLLTMIPMIVGIYRYSCKRVFSLFLFVTAGTLLSFYVYYFSMIRQCLAISCLYMAVFSLLKNELRYKVHTILLIILGICFHYSSVVALPFFLMRKFEIRTKVYISLLLLSLIIAVSANLFNLSSYVDLIFSFTGRDLSFYFSASKDLNSNWMAFVPTSLIAFVLYCFGSITTKNNLFVRIYSYGVLLNNVFSQLMPTNSDRFVLFYIISLIWVLPLMMQDRKIPFYMRGGLLMVSSCYFIYKFNIVLDYYIDNKDFIDGIAPYKSILF